MKGTVPSLETLYTLVPPVYLNDGERDGVCMGVLKQNEYNVTKLSLYPLEGGGLD